MTVPETIRACQKLLGVSVDGYAGPQTWNAIYLHLRSEPTNVSSFAVPEVDPRSEANIKTLLPEVQPYARNLLHIAVSHGIEIKVISGTRTFEEQDELYAQGRTKPGRIVTRARGGFSNHNFGIAFDIGVFDSGRYIEESPAYKAVAAFGKSIGLEWGGDWKSLVDEPHFELRPDWAQSMSGSAFLAELRNRKDRNTPVFS